MVGDGTELEGLNAVVVGAGAIGGAIALALARAGAAVGLTFSSNARSAESLAESIHAMSRHAVCVRCDVTDAEDTSMALAKIQKELGRLNIVVSAVGAPAVWKRIAELDPGEWARYVAVDLSGTFHVFRAAVPLMREQGGAIVALSSIAASLFQSRNAQGAAAKAGVEALVRVLAREEGRHNIRVNAVSIGLTESPATDVALANWGPETTKRIIAGIPLNRVAKPDEVADAVVFLAGPAGRYITGKVLAVDGGQYIGH